KLRSMYVCGTKKDQDKYLLIPFDHIPGNALRLESEDGTLQAMLCTAMPEHMRKSLTALIESAIGSNVLHQREQDQDLLFQALHFSWYNRFSTQGNASADHLHPSLSQKAGASRTNHFQFCPRTSADYRNFKDIYLNLTKNLAPDVEIQVQCCDSLPLNSNVPLFPFTGLVFNFNVSTKGHWDRGDLGFCFVMAFGNYEGGHLCLKEQGWVFDLRPGDFIIFDSSGTTHFNLLYRGCCGSIVGHTDKEFLQWMKDFNGWKNNIYLSATRRSANNADEGTEYIPYDNLFG
ncbi:hypothetical protein OE88DRAFT_1626201, partial [Heliocybe sulcata]